MKGQAGPETMVVIKELHEWYKALASLVIGPDGEDGELLQTLGKVGNGLGLILGLVNGSTVSILNTDTGKYERIPKWKAIEMELEGEKKAIVDALDHARSIARGEEGAALFNDWRTMR